MKAWELKIPPVVVALIMAAGMWPLSVLFTGFSFDLPERKMVAAVISILGGVISITGVISFRRAGTTVNPMQIDAASSLVMTGIFAITRNPIYLGLVFVLLAWFVYLSNFTSLIMVPLFVLYMNCFQILPKSGCWKRNSVRSLWFIKPKSAGGCRTKEPRPHVSPWLQPGVRVVVISNGREKSCFSFPRRHPGHRPGVHFQCVSPCQWMPDQGPA